MNLEKLIENNFVTVNPDATIRDLLPAIEQSVRNIFPLVDAQQRFYGIVILDDVRSLIFHEEKYDMPLKDVAFFPTTSVTPDEKMISVVEKFRQSGLYNMIVIDENNIYYGFISRANVFSTYREIIEEISED